MFLQMTARSAVVIGETGGVNSASMSSRTGVTWDNGVVSSPFDLRSSRNLHECDMRCEEVEVGVSVIMGVS